MSIALCNEAYIHRKIGSICINNEMKTKHVLCEAKIEKKMNQKKKRETNQ